MLLAVVALIALTAEQQRSLEDVGFTKTTLVETRVNLSQHPFPAVSVCPLASILKTIALNRLRI